VAKVLRIGLRSSVVRNRSGHEIVVPNKTLVANPVTNYSLSDSEVRIDIPVGVSYRSDPRQVEQVLLEVAQENEVLLRRPKPRVLFREFGESSLDFELRVWLNDEMLEPKVRSQLLFAIWYKLEEAGIVSPFPQRDVHVHEVSREPARPSPPAGGSRPARKVEKESSDERADDIF
jgi:small-conductance mechanosensitive channel